MNNYKVTWRHEVEFEAKNDEAALVFWENLDLGYLDDEVYDDKNTALSHNFVELKSFECVSDKNRNVPK